MTPKVLFEDDSILVLDKPPGLVVDISETQTEDTLENWLSQTYEGGLKRQGIVHRLDKDTSGVIIVAKTEEALENLQSQFATRVTKKEYLALVHGVIQKPGKIEGAIGRNPGNREKFAVLDDGKDAVTEYQPILNFKFKILNLETIFEDFNKIQMKKLQKMNYGELTLLRCLPTTGRTHQIRVHLKYLGFPIVSDEKYVGRKVYRLDKRWCPRQFLHAAKIGFKHPKTGEWMEVESKLSEDLEKALNNLTDG